MKIPKSLKKWMACKRCELHRYRRQVVMGRGEMPADLLFIGEAPGKSEDLLGEAFVGPAGRILNKGIAAAMKLSGLDDPPSYYITNVLACRPTDRKNGENRQPTKEEAIACWPRLEEIERLVEPQHIVFLGKVPESFCKRSFPAATPLRHPAYLLRLGGIESREYMIFCRALSEVFLEIAHA